MYNTPENRAAFVERFGPAQHPNGPWSVGDRCASIILRAFDRDPDRYWKYGNLWPFIMQNRETFMLGETYLIEARPTKGFASDSVYEHFAQHVTSEIYDFVKGLKEYTP